MSSATVAEDSEAPLRRSLWKESVAPHHFAPLADNISVDVAIVGAGITGLTAAVRLCEEGKRVAVLEARSVAGGTSGHSTGNLYAPVDECLHRLDERWGIDVVREVVRSRLAAIDFIEAHSRRMKLDCGFARRPWALYTLSGEPADTERLEAEYGIALTVGLDARLSLDLPLPYPVRKAMVIPGQAQFNPYRYLRRLADTLASPRCTIYERSPVTAIDEEGGELTVGEGGEGFRVRADHIVLATHVSKGVQFLQTELAPYRDYAVAGLQDGYLLPGGIFWSLGDEPTSVRSVEIAGKNYVLMVGEKHKTGQGDDEEGAYRRLSHKLVSRFNLAAVDYRWSAQHYRSADGLPYIGSIASATNVYVATGFAADGLAYGALAGMMIADEICGVDNDFAELYSPRRFTPLKSAVNFVKENINVAGRYLKDYAQPVPLKDLAMLPAGEGALADIGGEKLAAFRGDDGELSLLSPVCTHLRCMVQWNRAERSWDCPCHGSRFDTDGKVIEGPALAPLQKRTRPAS